MAADVRIVSKEDWPIIEKYLGEGVILVPPDVAEKFAYEYARPIPDGEQIDYDFGGDPDCWIDVLRDLNSCAADAIWEHFSSEDQKQAGDVRE